jgi:hypothetical protein
VFEASPAPSKDRLSSSSSSSVVSVIANTGKMSNKSAINPNYSVIQPMAQKKSDGDDSGKQFDDYFAKLSQVCTIKLSFDNSPEVDF